MKKAKTQRIEMKTLSPKELDSERPMKINIRVMTDSTALIFAVMRMMASTKTEIARKNKMTTKG